MQEGEKAGATLSLASMSACRGALAGFKVELDGQLTLCSCFLSLTKQEDKAALSQLAQVFPPSLQVGQQQRRPGFEGAALAQVLPPPHDTEHGESTLGPLPWLFIKWTHQGNVSVGGMRMLSVIMTKSDSKEAPVMSLSISQIFIKLRPRC